MDLIFSNKKKDSKKLQGDAVIKPKHNKKKKKETPLPPSTHSDNYKFFRAVVEAGMNQGNTALDKLATILPKNTHWFLPKKRLITGPTVAK